MCMYYHNRAYVGHVGHIGHPIGHHDSLVVVVSGVQLTIV